MSSLRGKVGALCQRAFAEAVDCPQDFVAAVTRATQPKFGHFQCNAAMSLAKVAKKNPREIAQLAVTKLQELDEGELFAQIEIAGPGFINLWVAPTMLSKLGQHAAQDRRFAVPELASPQRIVMDFSSPNVAKEMHVGHLRSTIIGDCLSRVLSFLGHDVLRLNHVGDWGTAFGMLIAYMADSAADVLQGKQRASLSDLMTWYRAAKQRFDAEPEFQDRARAQVVALQSGEAQARHSWEIICDVSYQAYSQIYDLLDIEIENRGESFYNDMLPSVLSDLQAAGLVEESAGAQCVFLPGFVNKDKQPLPMIVQKSDGGFNYSTTDLAALKHRIAQERAERVIYVTDAGQSLHFQMLFACAQKVGYFNPEQHRLDHVPFGLVLGAGGKKLKTRSGEVERLIDLLNTAIERAADIFQERNPDWDATAVATSARILGLGAVKYADLSNHRQSDYQFSYEKMLAFDGNTAAFILYAYVRTQSILRKVGAAEIGKINIVELAEVDLAIHLLGLPDMLYSLSEELTPHRLTDYLYKLACLFNAFFRDCRVEGVPEQADRLALIHWVAGVLQLGLSLLGIKTLDKM